MVVIRGGKENFEVEDGVRGDVCTFRLRREDLRLRMCEVIQREGVVHEDLLAFVLSGALMSINE